MGLPDIENIPDTGAVFTIGRSRFADNIASHFFIRKDPVQFITCGDEHSAVVCQSGRLFVFGSNDWGQLGLGHKNHISKPSCVKVLKPEKVTHVACGRAHTLICTGSEKIYSCGSDQEGQLGRGVSATGGDVVTSPVLIHDFTASGVKVVQVAAGSHHSMVLTDDGSVTVWGSNLEGQLGLAGISGLVHKPTKVQIPEPVKQISAGYYHSAFLTENGSVYVCGESESGKLGIDISFSTQVAPKQMQLVDPAVGVACGGHHTLVLTGKGDVYCSGSNSSGQLGCGSNLAEVPIPKLLPKNDVFDETERIIRIACGESHTAIVTDSGKLYTCGDGRHGKLGLEENQNNVDALTFASRYQELFVTDVACGGCHTILVGRRREIGSEDKLESVKPRLSNPLPPLKVPSSKFPLSTSPVAAAENGLGESDPKMDSNKLEEAKDLIESKESSITESYVSSDLKSLETIEKPESPEKLEDHAKSPVQVEKENHSQNLLDEVTDGIDSKIAEEPVDDKPSVVPERIEAEIPEAKDHPVQSPPPKPPRLKSGSPKSDPESLEKSDNRLKDTGGTENVQVEAGAETEAQVISDEMKKPEEPEKGDSEKTEDTKVQEGDDEQVEENRSVANLLKSARKEAGEMVHSIQGNIKSLEAEVENKMKMAEEEKLQVEAVQDDADVQLPPAKSVSGKMASLFRNKNKQLQQDASKNLEIAAEGVAKTKHSKTCTLL